MDRVDPIVLRIQALHALLASEAGRGNVHASAPSSAANPAEKVERIELHIHPPAIHVETAPIHVDPTPVTVDNHHHAGPINVHVPPAAVNVHPPAPVKEKPVPAKAGKRKVVIERDARGNVTGAEIQDDK